MDGVLLKVRNRKEEYHTWSLIATTGQILALRLSLLQTLMSGLSLFACYVVDAFFIVSRATPLPFIS
jgi:hypothetical protein